MSDKRPAGAFNDIVKSIHSNKSAGANAKTNISKTLRCVFCEEATYAPPSINAKKKVISCKSCTATSTTQLTCMICSKKLPLNKFANNQRKNHERARCKKCIKKYQDEDVWSEDDIMDSDDDY
ncbi:hypothetical protein MAM1_0375d10150 [Mucor ambiguus]|uniref:Stc1 domain-containing protein n=1 Tax=Mucor ambiguus TaxID=91626 RepID=A0A0C9MID5_9FUNG|nr:hypothetical protein MAM1_0375d10150 [Mucor ambiguus]